MAYTYKSINAAIGTTADTVVLNNTGSDTWIVNLCQVANVDGTNSVDLNIDYYDSDATSAMALVSTLAVPADSAINPIGGKLTLEPGDQLRAWASAVNLEIVISYIVIS